MKKMRISNFKRILSVFLTVVMVFSMIPVFVMNVGAVADYTKIADPPTVNDWKVFFGPNATNTTWAGGVWSDKSVFTSVVDYIGATDEAEGADFNLSINDDSFLVALSTIASSKSVEGYSTLPTDTILVLDLSGSMDVDSGTDPYVTMVNSANSAIETLLNLNANNRVGVIAFSGNTAFGNSASDTATVILPLGRWTKGIAGNNQSAYLVSSWRSNNSNRSGVKVASGVTGTVAEGVKSTFSTNNSKQVAGGTYTQNGIYKAQQMFGEVTDTVVGEGIQAGAKRKPVMVLMSDGCPTAATTDYTKVNTSNSGDGGEGEYGSNGIAFMTQLTAAWAVDKIEEKYDTDALVYTLGLNVGNKAPALSLLDPSNNTSTDSYWNAFKGLADRNNKTMSVNINNYSTENKTITYTDPVNEQKGWSEDYVTQYFSANSTSSLNQAFEDIVQQIIIQSLYYPTLVDAGGSINHDGFLEFDDYIGKNMEVKAVKGIQLGSKLYDGSTFSRMIYTGGMGTVENPTEAGDNMVWAVMSRMGIDDAETARQLIDYAYAAGQLYYNAETGEHSNYIGWYADKSGKYVGFWDGEDASFDAVPDALKGKAVYANKSYGYYDAVGEGHRKTDMMYATILVRTTIDGSTTIEASEAGDTRVIGRIPASLIPLVEYDIQLNGTDPMDPASLTIKGATAPSRLLYEVGLSSKIDLLDIENTAPDPLIKDEDGNYVFYTNQWNSIDGENYEYKYSENKNTISFFEPSKENERYYYNIDTPIYTDKNGTLYKSSNAPVYDKNNPLYHRSIVYRINGGKTVAFYEYEEISQHVLTHEGDIAKKSDNSWYVTAGTVHHYYGDYQRVKKGNSTGTIGYSDMPFVHDLEVGVNHSEYHVDSFLGNNGKFTLDPYEGIKVSKTADATITDREQSFEFIVTADVNANLTLIKEDAQGNRTESTVAFNNSLNVSIKHGETFWLLGEELAGKTVTVKEKTEGKDYEVLSVNGDTTLTEAVITVADDTISSAEFVNTIPQNGDIVISKTVVSEIAGHFDDEFTFLVTITGGEDGAEYPVIFSGGAGSTIASGETIKLSHNESATIKDIPENAVVTVKEIDIPLGFTADQTEKSATIAAGGTEYFAFTNSYDAEDTDPANISIAINKNLTDNTGSAADWSGSFKFQLQQWNGSEYVDFGSPETVNYSKGGANTVAIDLLRDKVYPEVGNYYYRVVEVVEQANVDKGIIYDTVYGRFYVTVADNESGKLFVESINSLSDTEINGNNVTVTFNNTYNVTGAVEAVIDINKVVRNAYGQTANVLPAGFSFSLYEANEDYEITNDTAVAKSPTTAAAGTARISVLYDEQTDKGTHYYVLKEDKGNIDNITYTDKEYHIEVTVDDDNGYYSIAVNVYDEDNGLVDSATVTATASSVIAVAEVEGANFENIYTPDKVTLTRNLTATKNLLGRDIVDGEFTFAVYETGADFVVGANQEAYLTADADQGGIVSFGELSYSKEGVHYYVVKEVIPEGAVDGKFEGVTYDEKEYHITVTVTGDSVTGQLSAVSSMTLDGADTAVITFNNSYIAKPVSAEIVGAKHLAGGIRKLQARAFSFELIENGEVIDTVYNDTPTDDYNAGFKFSLSYNSAGEHTYIVREKHPEGIDASGKLNGVVYDLTEYEVKISVVDDGNGKLVATVDYIDGEVKFNNSYNVTSVSIPLNGTKNLIGDSISKYVGDKAFEFNLYAANDLTTPIATAYNDENGAFNFSGLSQLTFSSVGGYRFVIKESVPETTDPLMVYDTAYFEVEIDITDNLLGSLVYDLRVHKVADETTEADSVVFNNEYKAKPITVPISGTKSYNKTLTDGMFTFELYQALPDASGDIKAVGEAVLEAKNVGESFTFTDTTQMGYLTFSKEGTYYYVVKEKLPEGAEDGKLNGVKYDTADHIVTVTVTEVIDSTGRAVLNEEVSYTSANGLIVVNEYSTTDATFTLSGTKELKGRDLTDGEFTFVLYDKDGGEIDRQENDVDGNFTFKTFTFSNEGTYTYFVKEDTTKNEEGMAYDTSEYKVVLTVTDNGKGELVISDEYFIEEKEKDEILFVNEFTEKVEVPDTGDGSNITLWLIIAGVVIIGLAVLLIIGRKNSSKED